MARAKRSIANSGSPSQFFTQPPQNHASAKLELSISARSIKPAAALKIENKMSNAHPLVGDHDRVILAQLNRPLGEPRHFGNFVRCL